MNEDANHFENIEDNVKLFEIQEVDQSVIMRIINELNTTYSKDIYNLDTVFKKNGSALVKPLTHLINLSIRTGQFLVKPIFKSGNSDDMVNYRPISRLPVPSKVLEKVVSEQFLHHLENNNLLHPLQFGFRHNYSTETATCLLLENIKSLDKGFKVGAVFLDLKKTFDTVNHNILMSKITKYNISKQSQSWFDSYLKSREQSVFINNVKSVPHNIDIGIPQGIILSPILFSIYINDLPEVCPDASLPMYADDMVIYVSGRNCVEIEEKLSRNLEKVSAWLDASFLTLNTKKSICFSIRKLPVTESLNIRIKDEIIEQVSEEKYLGMILDSQLNFKRHVKKLCKTIKANLASFRIIRNCLTCDHAFLFLNSMILSHMVYGLSVWSQTNQCIINQAECLYNRALKVLDRKQKRYHHLMILSFAHFVFFHYVKLVFKCLNGLAPMPLCQFFVRLQGSSRSTRAASSGNCSVIHCKTSFAQTVLSVKGVKKIKIIAWLFKIYCKL